MPFRAIVRIAFATTSALAVQIARAITEDVSFVWVTASTRLRRKGTHMSISLQIARLWKILRRLTITETKDRMLPARHGAGISPGMNTSDQAYHTLRAKILEGLFKPGSLLKERELCEQPSVSRTPIREALRRLSTDGLVEVRPRRSILVSSFDKDELAEIFELEIVLESFVARLAASRSELAEDLRFRSNPARLAHRDALTAALGGIFPAEPVAHWTVLLAGAILFAPVDGLGEALDNPWLEIIGMRDRVDHPDRADVAVLANPLKHGGRRLPDRAAPLLGADSDAILGEFGHVADEIAALRSSGLV